MAEFANAPQEIKVKAVRIINGKELKELPAAMFTNHTDRILADFGRGLDGIMNRGFTVEEAFVLLTAAPKYISSADNTTASHSEYLLKSMLLSWRKSITDRKDKLIDEVHDLSVNEEGTPPVVNPVTVLYQSRYKESNECCVDYGQWCDWKTITKVQYEDTLQYISWGRSYEVRRLGVIEEEEISNKIISTFDSQLFIDTVDRPGFAWNNLNSEQQKNLIGSVKEFFEDQAANFNASVVRLFKAIRHGDEAHEAWLKEAIIAHFHDKPLPEFVRDTATKVQDDLETDEPIFVLRGRDPQAPDMIETWANDRLLCEPNSGKAESALAIARAMRQFKINNPSKGMLSSLYTSLIRKDTSKIRAWTETLLKAIAICRSRSYSGDASTLSDIKDYLNDNGSIQPRVKNHFNHKP